MLFAFYFVVWKRGARVERSLVFFCWLLQSFISMVSLCTPPPTPQCFIIYWQRNGQLCRLVEVVPWRHLACRVQPLKRARICKTFVVFYSLLGFTLIVHVIWGITGFLSPRYAYHDPDLLDVSVQNGQHLILVQCMIRL